MKAEKRKSRAVDYVEQPVQFLAIICRLLLDGKSASSEDPWDCLQADTQAEFQRLSQACSFVVLRAKGWVEAFESMRRSDEVSCWPGHEQDNFDFCSSADQKRPTDWPCSKLDWLRSKLHWMRSELKWPRSKLSRLSYSIASWPPSQHVPCLSLVSRPAIHPLIGND